MIMFDTKGGLHKGRDDIKADTRLLPQVGALREDQSRAASTTMEEAINGADVLIALTSPAPTPSSPNGSGRWPPKPSSSPAPTRCRRSTPTRPRKPGAYIVATGRGDFPNQVNNSLGFPGILKGALLVRARKITDEMAIAAAYSLANFAEKKAASTPTTSCPPWTRPRSSPTRRPTWPCRPSRTAWPAIEMTWDEVFKKTMADINEARDAMGLLMEKNFIRKPDIKLLEDAVKKAVEAVK